MSLKHTAAALAALAFLATVPAVAQDAKPMDHDMSHDMADMTKPEGDTGLSSTAFAKANADMHKAMDITYTGKADVDFVRGMIAHHEGAIAMAKIELQYGTDKTIRALAEDVVKAQEAEVKIMKAWLAKNGG